MLLTELRQAARHLTRSPKYTLACVLTLALPLCAAIILLNLLETFVFRRLDVVQPDRLLSIQRTVGGVSAGFSPQSIEELDARQGVLTGICGLTTGYGGLTVEFGAGRIAQRPYEAVTGDCYDLLGVDASLGRVIVPEDASAPIVVIGHDTWRNELGASPDVIGQTVRVEGVPMTIIGVFPATYRGFNADEAPTLALPLETLWKLRSQPQRVMDAVGRLRPGVEIAEARAALQTAWTALEEKRGTGRSSSAEESLRIASAASGLSVLRERYRRPLFMLLGLAGCLLVLACVNVGGLVLTRLIDDRQSIAVQLALGAHRSRLAARLLLTSLTLAASAAALAVPLARWGADFIARSLWTGSRAFSVAATDATVTWTFAGTAGLLSALMVSCPGLLALRLVRWELAPGARVHQGRSAVRRGLVAAQIGISFALTFGAGIFAINLYSLSQRPIGYTAENLHWVRLDSLPTARASHPENYAHTLWSRVSSDPAVENAAVTATFGLRRQDDSEDTFVRADGLESPKIAALYDRVSPTFFMTARIPLLRGREFTWAEVSDRASVAVVSRSLARRLFRDGDAIGKAIRVGDKERRMLVVGVAADASLGDPRIANVSVLYLPITPEAPAAPVLLVRSTVPALPEEWIRGIVEPLGLHQVVRVSTMGEQVRRFLVEEQLITSISFSLAVLALIVSLAGLCATLLQDVIRRLPEIGVRIALGATPRDVRMMVLKEALEVVLFGVIIGIPGAVAARYASNSLLTGAVPHSGFVLLLTAVIIFVLGTMITVWPARRAARTPVSVALRAD